jgi:hypothetical protein
MTPALTPPTEAEVAPVQIAELAVFTRQLGAMLDAGVNVLRALRIASQHSRNDRIIGAAREIALRLEDGREFHQAVAPDRQLFDPFYVEMTRQGEADGQLGQALLAVADYLDRAAGIDRGDDAPAIVGRVPGLDGGASLVLSTLGVLALGVGGFWAATAGGILPGEWLGPAAALWSGACLLCGGRLFQTARGAPAPLQALPPKTQERHTAETEAVVRSALDEQVEAGDAPAQAHPETPTSALNGKAHLGEPESTESGPPPPRFQL